MKLMNVNYIIKYVIINYIYIIKYVLLNLIDVKAEEGLSKAIQIERFLIGNPIHLSGKQFLFEGEMDEITPKSQVKIHAFLFEDVLVYSHTKIGSFWKYKGCIELKPNLEVRIIENPQTFENVFQIVDGNELRTFFGSTPKEMNDWVSNLTGAIDAIKKKAPELKKKEEKEKKEKEKLEKEEKERKEKEEKEKAKKEKEEKEKKEKEEKEKEKAKKEKEKEKEREKKEKEKEKEREKKEKEKAKKEKEKEKEKAKKEKEKAKKK